jgi:hypothetical protein
MNANTIINLKVITCLEPFQKLNTRAPLFQIKNYRYLPEWLCRFIDGSSRDSDFGRINDLYAAAIRDKKQPNMEAHLRTSVRGLESLKKTYENDTTTVARIETLIEHIKHEIGEEEEESESEV